MDATDYALDIREGRITIEQAPKKLRPAVLTMLRKENKLIERARDRAAARLPPPCARMVPVRYVG